MVEKSATEVIFKYIFSNDYNPKYANGVYGGISTSADIVANFYFERHALPMSVSHLVQPNGSIGDMIANDPIDLQKSMVRVIENGVILNLNTAKALHSWLGEQIILAEKLIKGGKK